MYSATCAVCGSEARVPFEPSSDRPVYCRSCYGERRRQWQRGDEEASSYGETR